MEYMYIPLFSILFVARILCRGLFLKAFSLFLKILFPPKFSPSPSSAGAAPPIDFNAPLPKKRGGRARPDLASNTHAAAAR